MIAPWRRPMVGGETQTPAPGAAGASAVDVSQVSLALGGRVVLDGVSLDVGHGQVFGIVGPNGAGKTTLLRVIAGSLRPETGSVHVLGRELVCESPRERAKLLAVVPQVAEAPSAITVSELAMLGRHPHIGWLRRESATDTHVTWRAMRDAGCEQFGDRPLGTLSGGERRRAFIARALAQEPRLLLLDEPTANLDPGAGAELFETLRRLAASGVTVVVVAHDLTLAAAYCDRLALLVHGRVLHIGDPASVLTAAHVRAAYGERVEMVTEARTGALLLATRPAHDGRDR